MFDVHQNRLTHKQHFSRNQHGKPLMFVWFLWWTARMPDVHQKLRVVSTRTKESIKRAENFSSVVWGIFTPSCLVDGASPDCLGHPTMTKGPVQKGITRGLRRSGMDMSVGRKLVLVDSFIVNPSWSNGARILKRRWISTTRSESTITTKSTCTSFYLHNLLKGIVKSRWWLCITNRIELSIFWTSKRVEDSNYIQSKTKRNVQIFFMHALGFHLSISRLKGFSY